MTAPDIKRFDPDNPDTYADLAADLRTQVENLRAEWLANRDDADVNDRHNEAMQHYADARRHWREIGIAAGTRGDGVSIAAQNNTEGN